MKKRLLSFFITAGILSGLGNATAQTAVSVSWGVYGEPMNGTAGDGNVYTATDFSPGINSSQSFGGGMRIFSGANQNSGSAITDVGNIWQRIAAPILDPNSPSIPRIDPPTADGMYNSNYYIEFSITATGGKWLQVTGFKIPIIGFGTGDARLVAKYSVNGAAESDFKFFYKKAKYWVKTGDHTGEVQDRGANVEEPIALKRNRYNGTDADGGQATLADVTLTFSDLEINVAPGNTFRVRLYPYLAGTGNISVTGSRGVMIVGGTEIAGKTSDTALPSVLPLDILSFTAKSNALGNAVNLEWQTTNEVNTQEFVVERRTDDTEFTAIASIASKNTSGVHNYSFTDNQVVSGNVYYRLKQVDRDANFNYSEIAQVNVAGALGISVYPNPVEEVLSVSHGAGSNASIKVLSLDGKVIANQSVSDNTAVSNINVASLPAGTYLVVYSADGQQTTSKFIKN